MFVLLFRFDFKRFPVGKLAVTPSFSHLYRCDYFSLRIWWPHNCLIARSNNIRLWRIENPLFLKFHNRHFTSKAEPIARDFIHFILLVIIHWNITLKKMLKFSLNFENLRCKCMHFCIISINIHEFLLPKKGNSVNFNDYKVSSDVIYIENALQSLNNFSVCVFRTVMILWSLFRFDDFKCMPDVLASLARMIRLFITKL